MSRQLESEKEQKLARMERRQLNALNGSLPEAVGRAGGTLLGFSARMDDYEVLLTIRAEFPGGRQIAFVGGDTLGSALVKAVREASRDELAWRADRFAT